MDNWQAEQDRDRKMLEFEVEKVIEAAASRPITHEEQLLLAWASGTKPKLT